MSTEREPRFTKLSPRSDGGSASYPPPTKCTISRRSPSLSGVSDHWARETISRLSSTATRSPFIPSRSISCANDRESGKLFSSPLMNKRIEEVSGFELQVASCKLQVSNQGTVFRWRDSFSACCSWPNGSNFYNRSGHRVPESGTIPG